MSKFRVLGSTILAVCLALGVSSAALGTDLVVGHGIPKVKVDVCVKTSGGLLEVASNFKYGKIFKAALPAGDYVITVRAASQGTCKGAVLIKAPVTFDGTEDLSIIATKTKGQPTVVVFDNSAGYGPGAVFSIKHAAMLGKADVYWGVLVNDKFAPSTTPTASGVPKGAQADIPFVESDVKVGIAKTGTTKLLNETPYWAVRDGFINHVVAIGPPGSFRFLRYRTPIPEV